MAKTKGQLLSLKAAGSLGGVLTYQGRKGFRHTHIKATPKNPKSSAQTTDRANFAEAVAFWKRLTNSQKQVYNNLGSKYNNIPGFNVFIKLNKGKIGDWYKFGNVKFGTTGKFGGPLT